MNNIAIRPVVLCGGNGTRLWPVSRKSYPKQFSNFTGDDTLLRQTIDRLNDVGCEDPLLMAGQEQRFIVSDQVSDLCSDLPKIVIEPAGRNTAPAICAAAEIIAQDDPKIVILVSPSDHVLDDLEMLQWALQTGAERAQKGDVVVFGVRPDRAETGYGYIELPSEVSDTTGAVQFVRFVEKPTEARAHEMLAENRFLWNSGMFMFTAQTVLALFEEKAPDILSAVRASVRSSGNDLCFTRLGDEYLEAPEISFDYAVMEKTNGVVVPLSCGWNDMGSWKTIWQEAVTDENAVAHIGNAKSIDCKNSIFRSDHKDIAMIGVGLSNIIAVATSDAVLVANINDAQAVGQVVPFLKSHSAPQAEQFRRSHRPWGYFETLSLGNRFQVKSIVVKSGEQLSLQSHVHRAEHWIVVTGSATVIVDQTEQLLTENQSIYIPLGAMHRLSNPGKVDLHLIEVQTGAYLGEDDIVRYEDNYARTTLGNEPQEWLRQAAGIGQSTENSVKSQCFIPPL